MTSQSTDTPEKLAEPSPTDKADTRLWVGIWGGGIAWTVHFLSAALIAEWGCLTRLSARSLWGITAVAWSIILVSVVMALVAAVVTWVAYGEVLRLNSRSDEKNDLYDRLGNRRFMARTGFAASAFFLLIIIAQSLPILFFLSEC